jgi:hypothetical protein
VENGFVDVSHPSCNFEVGGVLGAHLVVIDIGCFISFGLQRALGKLEVPLSGKLRVRVREEKYEVMGEFTSLPTAIFCCKDLEIILSA